MSECYENKNLGHKEMVALGSAGWESSIIYSFHAEHSKIIHQEYCNLHVFKRTYDFQYVHV